MATFRLDTKTPIDLEGIRLALRKREQRYTHVSYAEVLRRAEAITAERNQRNQSPSGEINWQRVLRLCARETTRRPTELFALTQIYEASEQRSKDETAIPRLIQRRSPRRNLKDLHARIGYEVNWDSGYARLVRINIDS